MINPSYDDVEEDQPIDSAHDLEEIVLGGYAVKEIAKNRLISKEALVGSLGEFDLNCFAFRHRTFSPNNFRIRPFTLNPSLNHAQDGVHLAH